MLFLRQMVKDLCCLVPAIRRVFTDRDTARAQLRITIAERDRAIAALDEHIHANQAIISGTDDIWPSEYRANHPQRYTDNFHRYAGSGGVANPLSDVRGFVAGAEGNKRDMARFYFFCLIFDQILKEGLSGDVAELGVYKGNTATLLANFARKLGSTAYLLDTFEGFSERDLAGVDSGIKMEFSDTSLSAVRALVGESNTRFIQGYFPVSAEQMPDDKPFCLVHIDCDLYAPMLGALNYFYPRMVEGGFFVLHDYSSLHWPGAEKAIDEFFADKPESVIPMPDSGGSVVVRKARQAARFDNWFVRKKTAPLAENWVSVPELSEYLEKNWSGIEDWGVWGLGRSHLLYLFLARWPEDDVYFEFDVHAVVIGARETQYVDVLIAGQAVTQWVFTPENNRGDRTLRIPCELARKALQAHDLPVIAVEFAPHFVERPIDLDPAVTADTRPLGLGLCRVRQREAPAQEAHSASMFVRKKTAPLTENWVSVPELSEYLGKNWSDIEDWGVWGLGRSHLLYLFLARWPEDDVYFEFDVHAVVIGARETQYVDVLIAGQAVTQWVFTPENNRGDRTLRIPCELARKALQAHDLPVIAVEFAPHFVERPIDLDPAVTADTRPLGLGLCRVRQGEAPAQEADSVGVPQAAHSASVCSSRLA